MNTFGIAGYLFLAVIHICNATYIGTRLHRWLSFMFPKIRVKYLVAAFVVLTVVTLYSLMPMSLPISYIYHLRMIGGYLTGILLYILLFFIFADCIVFVGKVTKIISVENPSGKFAKFRSVDNLPIIRFFTGTVALFFATLVAGIGIHNATQISITTFEVELQRELDGEMTIVLLSDLHLGEVHSERNLNRMVAYINSLNPDIVCFAGDIFNDNFYAIRDPQRAAAIFRGIDATFGVFACLGNHDSGRTVGSMINFLEESNIRLLNDEHVVIDDRLVLIGRLNAPLPRLPDGGFDGMIRRDFAYVMEAVQSDLSYRGLPADLPVVIMDHNPTHIDDYGSDVDLALFGHTHAGGHFPFNMFTRLIYIVDHGEYKRDDYSPHVIVTQGVHMWSTPVRVGTRNEIVNILVR